MLSAAFDKEIAFRCEVPQAGTVHCTIHNDDSLLLEFIKRGQVLGSETHSRVLPKDECIRIGIGDVEDDLASVSSIGR